MKYETIPARLKRVLKKMNMSYSDVKNNVNLKTIIAGCELGYLTDADVVFMLDSRTTEAQAVNRLIFRRRSVA